MRGSDPSERVPAGGGYRWPPRRLESLVGIGRNIIVVLINHGSFMRRGRKLPRKKFIDEFNALKVLNKGDVLRQD